MKQLTRSEFAKTRWADLARQLPIAITNEGEVVGYVVPRLEDLIDISKFPILIKREILSRVEMVKNAGLG